MTSVVLGKSSPLPLAPRSCRGSAGSPRRKFGKSHLRSDLVTEADEVAEAVITTGLKAAFPGAIIIGEEGTHKDPALLQSIAAAELAFIVDPIYGTKNFTANLPLFGVMAATTVRGEVVAGVIYDPVCPDWAYAVLGAGAWMEHEDGTRVGLRVAPPAPVSQMEGVIGTNFLPEPLRSTVNGNLSRLATTTWFRCAAQEYRMAAAGHCHLLFYYRLMPWDHAAGGCSIRKPAGIARILMARPITRRILVAGSSALRTRPVGTWRVLIAGAVASDGVRGT